MAKMFENSCEYWAFKKKLEREEDGSIKTSNGLRKAIEWYIKFTKLEIDRDEAFQMFLQRRQERAAERRVPKKRKKKRAQAEAEAEAKAELESNIEIEGPDEEPIDDTQEIIPDYSVGPPEEGVIHD